MAAISFPSSPTLNQVHTVGQRSWKYNGAAWKLVPRTTDAVLEGSSNLYYTDARVAAAPAVSALESRASAIESDIAAIESAAGSLESRVGTAEGEIDSLQSGLSTAQSDIDALEASVTAIGSAFNYVGTVTGGATSETATQLNDLTEKDTGDYYKVTTAGWFKVGSGTAFRANLNDGLVWNTASGVDIIDNTNSSVSGTANEISVSGSADTGFTVAIASAFSSRVSTLEGEMDAAEGRLDTAESDITSAEGRLDTAESDIDSLESRATTLETDLATAEGEIDTLQSDLDTAESDISALQSGKQIADVVSTTAPSHIENRRWIDPTDMSEYLSYGGVWVEIDKQ